MKHRIHRRNLLSTLTTFGTVAIAGLIAAPGSACGAVPATAEEATKLETRMEAKKSVISREPDEAKKKTLEADLIAMYNDYSVWKAEKEHRDHETTISLRQGTTLGKFVEDHRANARVREVNLLVSKEAMALTAPENMDTVGLYPEDVLQVLSRSGLKGKLLVEKIKGDTGTTVIVSIAKTESEEALEVFCLRGLKPFTSVPGRSKEEEFESLYVELYDAIQSVVDSHAKGHKVKIDMHRPTQLMIVSGSSQDVEVAKKVVLALGGKSSQ